MVSNSLTCQAVIDHLLNIRLKLVLRRLLTAMCYGGL